MNKPPDIQLNFKKPPKFTLALKNTPNPKFQLKLKSNHNINTETKSKQKTIDHHIHRTIKVPLKGFLKNPDRDLPKIKDTVDLVNQIVIRAYQLIRLFVLFRFQNSLTIPNLEQSFCALALSTVSKSESIVGAKCKHPEKANLEAFYNQHYLPLLNGCTTIKVEKISEILQKISIEMTTNYMNNISCHFFSHLKKYINIELCKVLPKANNKSKAKKREWSTIFRKIMNALHDKDVNLVPDGYLDIYHKGLNYLPAHQYDKGSFSYDILSNTNKYLESSLKLNQKFEELGVKLFQPLCLRNDMIPKYIHINIKSLIIMFDFPKIKTNGKKITKTEMINNYKKNNLGTRIWSSLFHINKRFMKQKGYTFYDAISTDGFGCSILFIKNKYRHQKRKPKVKLNPNPYQMINELSPDQLEQLKGRTLVGLDPGKSVIVMLMGKDGTCLKYTAKQRFYESFQKANKLVRDKLKTKNKLQEIEKQLNQYNCKTMDIDKFKDFIKVKHLVNNQVMEHYNQIIYRKLRLRGFINGRKSINNFLNKIEKTFGPNPVIGYGNWSRTSQMKYQPPTMGRGMRKEIHRRFGSYTIDEYGSSSYCPKCHKKVKNLYVGDHKIHHCLVCNECLSSKGGKGVRRIMHRDKVGSSNLLTCLDHEINRGRRPQCFQRAKKGTTND